MEKNKNKWLEIGTIVGPRGLKGELKVVSSTDFPERFEKPGQRWLQSPNGRATEPVELMSGKGVAGKNIYIIRLEGINNRNEAETLRGYKLLILDETIPELDEDEYHVSQLIDVEVYEQQTGKLIGTVVDLFTAGNDLLEIKLIDPESKAKKVLIPFVYEIVPVVDLENNRIEINPPKGLLTLAHS
ncbi:ribosome maturation factor RimM [Crocosphaera sp.]|uniref:ribosome maturation factor RimM n=1 Tax=Crocosphaera sp. TaxID=2729996 RepID=UPI003F2929C4|nr:ribosome maturation factor RimM [Crocosphaera sp.]